jgi:RNA polymerase sigma factor (sigma-70 family)
VNKIAEPTHNKGIFDRPGRTWTGSERIQIKEWLFAPEQLRALLLSALYTLGKGATAQDAEDAWGNFTRRLDTHIDLYDPARGRRFWNFLLFCFERFCWDEGDRLRSRRRRESPLEVQVEMRDGDFIELEPIQADQINNPDNVVEQQDTFTALYQCIKHLSPPYRTVVIMHYFEEKPITIISLALSLSVSNIKVRLHRARQQLAQCLTTTGVRS